MIAVMVVIIVVIMCLLVPVVMFRTIVFMVMTVQHALTERKRDDQHTQHQEAWEVLAALPSPGMPYVATPAESAQPAEKRFLDTNSAVISSR
jgi:membrane glycosyltransferase